MDKQETLKKVISRALLAAVGGGTLLAAASGAQAQNLELKKYVAVMSVQEHLEWLRKGGPRFCEMLPFDRFELEELATDLDVSHVQEIAQYKVGP
jgi:hypothetical protein